MFFRGMLAILITFYLPGVGHFLLGRFKKGFLIIGALLLLGFSFSLSIVRNLELFEKVQALVNSDGFRMAGSEELKALVETYISHNTIFMFQLMFALILAYAFTDIILTMRNYYITQRQQNRQ